MVVVVDSPGSPAESPTKLRSLLASFDLGRAVQWALLLFHMGRWASRSRPNIPQHWLRRGLLSLLRRRGAARHAYSGSHRRA